LIFGPWFFSAYLAFSSLTGSTPADGSRATFLGGEYNAKEAKGHLVRKNGSGG
jgi:hypothetical protein